MKNTKARRQVDIGRRLILQQWVLAKLGMRDFADVRARMYEESTDGALDEYLGVLEDSAQNSSSSLDTVDAHRLHGYHGNVRSHWATITARRGDGTSLQLKYFQYVALIATEIYLDAFFGDKGRLQGELNALVDAYNRDNLEGDELTQYVDADLHKLAYWQATGSGKTLIMHVNILQYRYYAEKYGASVNNTLLLTPNEGLTAQHLEEFGLSGSIPARKFDGSQTLSYGEYVEVVDIHKLEFQNKRSGSGVTIAIESFESNNLLLVDEGHRGSSGRDWLDKRRKLLEGGFSFEYSATFREAVGKDQALKDEYSKCIILDYSYKRFYDDGYGKESRIFNVSDDITDDQRFTYLVGSLLTLHEQLLFFGEHAGAVREFNLSKPLMVFVGNSVSAASRESTDVVDVLNFLAEFCHPRSRSRVVGAIKNVFSTTSDAVIDQNKRLVFQHHLTYLRGYSDVKGLYDLPLYEELYDDMLRSIFNVRRAGILHLSESTDHAEIVVRVGSPELGNRPFALISVGDTADLMKRMREHDTAYQEEHDETRYTMSTDRFARAHFTGLNDSDELNMLIGSRKFTEGWNSYRVSVMGLLNMGTGEGSQIIQLFGRGIRLLGHNYSLKRSNRLSPDERPTNQPHKYIGVLETLNVFGIRANYINTFSKKIKDAGISTITLEVEVKVRPTHANHPPLHVVVARPDIRPFENTTPFNLIWDEKSPKPVRVSANYFVKIQTSQSSAVQDDKEVFIERTILREQHVQLLNYDDLHVELVKYKRKQGYHNLLINREHIKALLFHASQKDVGASWYDMYIDKGELTFNSLQRIKRWQEIALDLLKRYCDAYYRANKAKYMAENREYRLLGATMSTESNMLDSVRVIIDQTTDILDQQFQEINEYIDGHRSTAPTISGVHFGIKEHLYEPVFSSANQNWKTVPTALNDGEITFLTDIARYTRTNPQYFNDKRVYVLRNLSRGHGFHFYEGGNFYPDFLLWVITADHDYLTFIDPKGIARLDKQENNPKVEFHRTIKQIEASLRPTNPRMVLNSFLVSVTRHKDIQKTWQKTTEQFNDMHILFQHEEDQRGSYIRIMLEKMGLTDAPEQQWGARTSASTHTNVSMVTDDGPRTQAGLFDTEWQ
jgi:hypothetical protein